MADSQLVASFDIGTRNLAYALAEVTEDALVVRRWGLKDLGRNTGLNDVVPALVAWLDETFPPGWDVVLIENQIGAKMRSIQAVVATHFTARRTRASQRVLNVTPKLKFVGIDTSGMKYPDRKAASVAFVTSLVFGDGRNAEHAAWFASHKKRDDLCDSLAQCIAHCGTAGSLKLGFECRVRLGS